MEDIDPKTKVLVFIPALVAVLAHAERTLGRPLTEPETLLLRDSANCVVMAYELALAGEEARGYRDIVAEDAWNEWRMVRKQIPGLPV
ncbi:hypothetical protein ABIE56_002123 [Luteibacter sp. 621]|uniref:hypothetical protein n=1 Tax=Luteibacter sp. 621 TaxID=3373916 RepID=UPI003D1C81EC